VLRKPYVWSMLRVVQGYIGEGEERHPDNSASVFGVLHDCEEILDSREEVGPNSGVLWTVAELSSKASHFRGSLL
jgi:hypothetical protein